MKEEANKFKKLIIIGIVFIIIGVLLFLLIKDPSANNLEIAKNARSAQEAALAISKNNRSNLFIHMIRMFLLGIGSALTIFGLVGFSKSNKK